MLGNPLRISEIAIIKICLNCPLTTGSVVGIIYIIQNVKELGNDKPSVFASILNLAVE
jgi:hypothetical protein